MGRTRFSGPAYGGKQTLFSVVMNLAGSSGVFGRVKVPAHEDWYVTELGIGRESTGVSTQTVVVLDDSTQVALVALGSTAATSTVTAVTPTAGEDEGARIVAGSEVTFRLTSTATGNISFAMRGYPRWVD